MRKPRHSKEDELTLTEYVQDLERVAIRQQLPLAGYPNLSRLLRMARLEQRIDAVAIERERRHLLDALPQRLSHEDRQALLAHQLAFQAGRISEAEYHKGLGAFGRLAGIHLTSPPDVEPNPAGRAVRLASQTLLGSGARSPYANLSGYIELLSEALQHERVLPELEELRSACKDRLLATPDQRALDQLTLVSRILRDLYDVRLSRELLQYYRDHQAAFAASPFLDFLERHRRLTPALRDGITQLFDDRSAPERFYELALQRDDTLVANTLQQMDEQGQAVAILVAGGFHTKGIARRLKDRGIAYAVIAPAIEGDTDEELYHRLLLDHAPSVKELIAAFSKEAGVAERQIVRGDSSTLSPELGIFASSSPYLRESWTYLNTVLLSLKGWTVQQIQAAYGRHPTLANAFRFAIKANGDGETEVAINGSTLTYSLEDGLGSAVSFEGAPIRTPSEGLLAAPGREPVRVDEEGLTGGEFRQAHVGIQDVELVRPHDEADQFGRDAQQPLGAPRDARGPVGHHEALRVITQGQPARNGAGTSCAPAGGQPAGRRRSRDATQPRWREPLTFGRSATRTRLSRCEPDRSDRAGDRLLDLSFRCTS